MSKKQKYYTVWNGKTTGVFESWDECKEQITGVKNAQYKSFDTLQQAQDALKMGYWQCVTATKNNDNTSPLEQCVGVIANSLAVDAACSGNPGVMEYQGVRTYDKERMFHVKFELGTNNIGEFLAIVHCLAWQQKNKISYPIYSDSLNAQKWVREGICKTKLVENEKNAYLFSVIRRAEKWLRENSFRVPIYKWKTDEWGEIPADFGRK